MKEELFFEKETEELKNKVESKLFLELTNYQKKVEGMANDPVEARAQISEKAPKATTVFEERVTSYEDDFNSKLEGFKDAMSKFLELDRVQIDLSLGFENEENKNHIKAYDESVEEVKKIYTEILLLNSTLWTSVKRTIESNNL
jgi:hypothetical protein